MSQYADQVMFAAGTLVATRTDIANSTPQRFGILQDVSVDISADLKELYGQSRYAIMLAPGKTKIEVKAKLATIRGGMFNDLFFGATKTATETKFADNEAGTIPSPSGPYTVTVSNSAHFLTDKGVFYSATGQPLAPVASGPIAGQYSVSAGVYTFAAADAAAGVYISYTYSTVTGVQLALANVRMGVGPSFSMVLANAYDGRTATFIFNQCMASKLSFPTKQDDFEISELDFMVSADVAGNVGSINTDL